MAYEVPEDELGGGGAKLSERYCAVACSVCDYECAVYGPDDEEIFHFFDVLIGPAALEGGEGAPAPTL